MRSLIDACVPRFVTNMLRNAGHDVVETRERGPDPGDFGIMQIAVREERILVTADNDFATLALRHGAAHHGIIELPQTSVEDLAAIVARILDAHPGEQLVGTVVIATETRLRSFRVMRSGS